MLINHYKYLSWRDQYSWKYCPSTDNTADLLTRGIIAEQLKLSDISSMIAYTVYMANMGPVLGVTRFCNALCNNITFISNE